MDITKSPTYGVLSKTNWTDPNVDLLIHEIFEYDMSDGGFSIIRQHRLIDEQDENRIAQITDKHERHVAVGNLSRDKKYKGLSKTINEGFRQYRCRFGAENELSPEDILSIKKDAIFTKKHCDILEFGQYVKFRERNVFQAFMRIKKLEVYWNEDGVQIKGIQDEVLDKYHRNYSCDVIWRFMKKLTQYDYKGAQKYLVRMMDQYKQRKLAPEYYRTFDALSIYPVELPNMGNLVLRDIGPDMLPMTRIDFNYKELYLPLLNIATAL